MGTFRFALSAILGITLTYAVQRIDRARLSHERRAYAWNTATWGAALYAFGPLSMTGWVFVTRQRFWHWYEREGLATALLKSLGLALVGLAAGVAIALVIACVDWAVAAMAGVLQ